MSLLDDVSIVVTPNGYKAGTLYSVLPTAIAGSELVQDSNFTLTGTQAQNTAGTYWVTYAGWTISGGKALRSGVSGNSPVAQNVPVVNGKVYKFSYTRTYASGNGETNLFVQTDGSNYVTLGRYISTVVEEHTVTGTFVAGFTGNIFWQFYGIGTFAGSVDNISVKEWSGADMDVTRATAATRVDENGLVNYAEVLGSEIVTNGNFATDSDWTKGTGWTISGGKANCDGSQSSQSNLYQAGIVPINKRYKATFTITVSAGTMVVAIGGSNAQPTISVSDTYTFISIATSGDSNFYFSASSDFVGNIDNVSVKEVTRDNVPRIDYTGGGCPHILAEPQRTNLVTYSESISNLSRTTNGTGTLTITDNYTDSPQGLQNASRVQMSIVDTNDTSNYRLINAGSVMITGVTREISFYAKSLTGSNQDVLVYWSYDQQIVTLTNDWQRFKISATSGSSSKVFIGTRGGSGSYFSGGDANLDFALWGLQVEDDGSGGGSSYATSYIPTSGSTVTRNQDVFTRDGIGSLINSTEGVLFLEMAALSDDGTNRVISLYSDSNNRVSIFYSITSNTIFGQYVISGSSTASLSFALSDTTLFSKIAFKYKENDFALWVDGVEVDTDSSGLVLSANTLNNLDFNLGNSTLPFYGKVKQLQVYDTALTDMQLIQLTGTAGTDFYESYSEMAESLTYTIQ